MNYPKRISLALALGGALLAGCASGKGGPQTTISGGEGYPGATELDSGMVLMRDLEILHPNHARRDGFLLVQFDLHNKRGSSMDLEWTVDWFDADGMKIDTNEPWRPLVIGGRGYETLQVTAPTPTATSWRLKTQKPNPVR